MGLEIILVEAKIPFSGKSIGLAAKCMIDRACRPIYRMHDQNHAITVFLFQAGQNNVICLPFQVVYHHIHSLFHYRISSFDQQRTCFSWASDATLQRISLNITRERLIRLYNNRHIIATTVALSFRTLTTPLNSC